MLYDPRWEPKKLWQTVLLDAADYIEEYGWCQYRWQDGEKVCALSAISVTAGRNLEAIGRLRKFLGGRIDTWNDTVGRTKDEVVAALRACALSGGR